MDSLRSASASAQTLIQAPDWLVWEVLTDLQSWPTWNPSIHRLRMNGPLRVGTFFSWRQGLAAIRSRIEQVVSMQRLVWSGRTLGLTGTQAWVMEVAQGGTRVTTQECVEGLLARLFRGALSRRLDHSLHAALERLKSEVERRMGSEG